MYSYGVYIGAFSRLQLFGQSRTWVKCPVTVVLSGIVCTSAVVYMETTRDKIPCGVRGDAVDPSRQGMARHGKAWQGYDSL